MPGLYFRFAIVLLSVVLTFGCAEKDAKNVESDSPPKVATNSTQATATTAAEATATSAAPSASSGVEKAKGLVTLADVEKYSKLTGITEVASGADPTANFDLTFRTPEGTNVLQVNVKDAAYFDSMVKPGETTDLPGVGDAAFLGASNTILMFKVGDTGVWLSTSIKVDPTTGETGTLFPQDGLKMLAQAMAGKIK